MLWNIAAVFRRVGKASLKGATGEPTERKRPGREGAPGRKYHLSRPWARRRGREQGLRHTESLRVRD